MTYPIVELAFWNPGDPGSLAIDALLADAGTPLAKHGLTGLAEAYAAEQHVPMHGVHRDWARDLAAKSLGVDGALAQVAPALDAAGIPFFVAKGPAIAYRDYPDPRLRPYSDLDVYVPTAHHADAAAVLARLGYTPVAQGRGVLGGVGREYHGGPFGAVVELHDSVVDNLHRKFLPPVEAFLAHTERTELCGADVPVLAPAAHVALQAIHLGAGHRYAKVICHRDIAARLHDADPAVAADLGAGPYLAAVVDVLVALDRAEVSESPSPGVLHRRLLDTLAATDPATWDEYRPSTGNVLALLNQSSRRHAAAAALSAVLGLVPASGRRVSLH